MKRGVIERTLAPLAERAGLELGQMYTVLTGVVVALTLGILGLPPVLGDGGTRVAASVSATGTEAPSPPTTVYTPVAPILPQTDDGPRPSPQAAPPTTVAFRPPPPPARDTPRTTTTTSTSTPIPRPPIPANPEGTTTVFATVPPPGAPDGVGVGPDGTVFVATDNAAGRGGLGPSEIIAFTASGEIVGSFAVTGQPEDRIHGLTGLAVDDLGRVLVADASTSRILRLDPSKGELSELVTVPDVASCLVTLDGPCEPGALDAGPRLQGLTISPSGAILVADQGQGVVWRYERDELTVAASVERRSPGEGPTGVAVRGGDIVVAVSSMADSVPPGQAAVLVFRDGVASVLATYDAAEGLSGLAVGASGRMYVALAGADAVEILDDDGPVRRVDGGTVSPGFDAPTGLTVDDGRILVTNQSTVADDPDHWIVHAIVNRDTSPTAR